ncbi:hypothetical protein CR513_59391, partial [Mucuna pruriens]
MAIDSNFVQVVIPHFDGYCDHRRVLMEKRNFENFMKDHESSQVFFWKDSIDCKQNVMLYMDNKSKMSQ